MSFVIEESFVKGKSLTSLCEDGWCYYRKEGNGNYFG